MSNINPNPFTTRPEIVGTFGVVASTHWIATAVGMSILERGGNAFDAAVAAAVVTVPVPASVAALIGENGRSGKRCCSQDGHAETAHGLPPRRL